MVSFNPYGDDAEKDDFRPVPRSDMGDGYADQGQLGGYSPDREPFAKPADVKVFTGYGATEADLARGYCEPTIREAPNYDLDDYKRRSSLPRIADDDAGETETTPTHWEFRTRNARAQGFLTRPEIPTERN